MSALAALSPGYWWFVALFALGRPMLVGTGAISGVIVAEETRSRDRAKAIALVTAAWGAEPASSRSCREWPITR